MKRLLMKILIVIFVLMKKSNVKMNSVKKNYIEKTISNTKKFVHLKKFYASIVKRIFFKVI